LTLALPGRASVKVSDKTKVEVRDKLRELHKEVDIGLRPRRRYTVGDVPKGQQAGLKSLTFEQAVSPMAAAKGTSLEAYIVLSRRWEPVLR
jgi:hypothetical protein